MTIAGPRRAKHRQRHGPAICVSDTRLALSSAWLIIMS